jgi:hypothetical protein
MCDRRMTEARTITEALATLILQGNVPLKGVAIAGEVIAIDARWSDYDGARTRAATFEQLGALLEAYDALLQRVNSSVASFSQTGDGYALIEALSETKEKLSAL